VLDALLVLHAQMHPAQDSPQPAAQARSAIPAPAPAPAAASIPLLIFGEACRLGAARLKLANVTFKHIPYDVKAR
jgi:adenine-specific DNA-methyltransferase